MLAAKDAREVAIRKRAMLQRQLASLVSSDVSPDQVEFESWEIRRQIIAATRTIANYERKTE